MSQANRKVLSSSDLLAAAAALAAGTQAYGEVVIFINPPEGEPGHFDWALSWNDFSPNVWLDITRPSTDQGGLVGPRSVGQVGGPGGPYSYPTNFTDGGASVASSVNPPITTSFKKGELIDGLAGPFYSHSLHFYFGIGSFGPGLSYMGVRFLDIDGYHYGWIAVFNPDDSSFEFDAFAWGYETEPGVPIIAGIPAPGTLAALAFGAALTGRRRNRQNN
jgi:hypothetical protein